MRPESAALGRLTPSHATLGELSNNYLLAALPPDCAMALQADFKQVVLPQGTLCCAAGDPIEQVYFPLTGMISLLAETGDGKTVETASIGRDGALGLQCGLGGRRSFTRAIVQVPGIFAVIPAGRFEQAADNSRFLRDLITRYTEYMWAQAQQLAACNAVHDGSSRLARWLLQTADQTGSAQLPLTQEFLAEMLGVRRTTVTLIAQEMQKKGMVRYSRGRITIVDRAALQAHACHCYSIIRRSEAEFRRGVKS